MHYLAEVTKNCVIVLAHGSTLRNIAGYRGRRSFAAYE
jgi:hypothetical protein